VSIVHTIREKVLRQEYEFAIPHFFEQEVFLLVTDTPFVVYKRTPPLFPPL
jgi:hypothetical protein